MKRRMGKIGKLLLALALYISAAAFAAMANKGLQTTQIVLDTPVSGAAVQEIQRREWEEEAPLGFCFWGERREQRVTCRETGGAAVVTQVLTAGNPGLLDAGALSWQPGCLVDRDTARDLFGTASVGSQVLWHNGRAYPVLGIVEAPRRTMVLPAEPEAVLSRLVLALPPEEGAAAGAQCLLRWGLSGDVLNPALPWALLRNALLVFPGLLAGLTCRGLARGWRDLTLNGLFRGGQRRRWAKALCAAGILAGTGLLLIRSVEIPQAMIPTKWSDFGFWARWWETEKEAFFSLLFTPLGPGQLQILLNMVKSVVTNLAACLVLMWPARRENHADIADRR